MNRNIKFFFTHVVLILSLSISAQDYYGLVNKPPFNSSELSDISFDFLSCECTSCCNDNFIGAATPNMGSGITMSPEGELFSFGSQGIFLIDQATGASSLYFALPPFPSFPTINGFVSVGNGVFYTVVSDVNVVGDTLIELNTVSGTITKIGGVGYMPRGELTMFNGEVYLKTNLNNLEHAIVHVDLVTPENSEIVVTFPSTPRLGLSATNICNTLIMSDENYPFVLVNLLDGALTYICSPEVSFITSMLEFGSPTICGIEIDLDCNDSSGATDADYNAEEFNCLTDPVAISDNDIGMLYDAIIEEMTIELTGSIPDAPFEVLISTGNVPNIDVSGSGTNMITLSNAGGAKSTDFKDALRLIRYDNTTLLPTAGIRTVEVQFRTETGSMSNVATAFIEVNELPLVDVDLGPDQEICEGEAATFNAGNPGSVFEWSSGQSTQIITADEEDVYIVTVSDGENCPNQDTVGLSILPVVHVSLEGDFQTCDNSPLTLIINTDSPFPLNVEITSNPGSPFVLNNVIGTYSFNDLPTEETVYTITSVTPSQAACIEVTDPVQEVDVYPSYNHSFDATICEGDSIWLGFYWEAEPGVYQNTFNTFDGCDSVVTTSLTVSPAINLFQQSTTCDISQVGIFFEYLANPNGCDTVIQTTVTLLPSDTTYVAASTCRLADAGTFTQSLPNQQGCDSVIITSVIYSPPSDSTNIFQTTCDSSALGITHQIIPDITGCDSIIITTVTFSDVDTTYTSSVTCDILQVGTTEQVYADQQGCDSLVITTTSLAIPDTTYSFSTSCDSASLGVFENHFPDQMGCDSVVFTTITYSASDSVFIQSVTCDPDEAGEFIQNLINRFGCDSIVTQTITLLPTDHVSITSSTCEPLEAGVFVTTLINQFGCDSIVTETVELLTVDNTNLFSTTCMTSQAGIFITTYLNQYGCDSIVTLTVTFVPADTTTFILKTCNPSEVGSTQIIYTNQDGCDSLVIEQTELHPLPQLDLQVTSDFNGYAISCFGEMDGSAGANVSGVPQFSYLWSTNETSQSITGLSAGMYGVTVTDGNGCTVLGDVTLTEPEEFSIGFIVTHPDCFDANAGSITVQQNGGVEPLKYSIDKINFQSSPVFANLSGGTYEITAIDANECEVKEIIWINVPLMVNVELGDDMQLFPGDTVVINAIVNVPYDSLVSITWHGLMNAVCPECLTQAVAPIVTTTYSVEVSTQDGCKDEDALTLFVENDTDVFVPNIFSPDGDGINDELIISAASGIEIVSFNIYDRWGNVVFEKFNALPEEIRWDGRFKNRQINPSVFAFRLIIESADNSQLVYYGDITLIR